MAGINDIILPSGFTRLKCIIGYGNQYIKTDYIPTVNTGIYVDAQADAAGDTFVMAAGPNGSSECLSCPRFTFNSNNSCGWYWNGKWDKFYCNGDGSRFQSSINFFNNREVRLYIDNSLYKSKVLVDSTKTYKYPFFIFGGCKTDSTTVDSIYTGRIFEIKISERNKLVRHFIPALDNAQSRPCLYEVIEGKPYYNAAGGEEFGQDKIISVISVSTITLPDRFTRVKYLVSTGTQYIDTGYIPNGETGLYLKGEQYVAGDQIPMGSRNAASSNTRFYPPRLVSNSSHGYGWGTWVGVGTLSAKLFESYLNFKNDKKAMLKEGTTTIYDQTLSDLPFTPTLPMYIFGANVGGVLTHAWQGAIYEAKIQQAAALVHHFIPAYDNYLNQCCLFDIKQNKAYYNQGTGSFTYAIYTNSSGPQLPSRYKRVNYLASNGHQRIETGYVPTNTTGIWVKGQQDISSNAIIIGSGNDENTVPNGIIAPRFCISKSNTHGFSWESWTGWASTGGGHVFESELNYYNSRKARLTAENGESYESDLQDLTFTPVNSLLLFGTNNKGGDTSKSDEAYAWKGKIFEVKITEGATLKHHFYPVYDTVLQEPCMYDIVSVKPYYNTGYDFFQIAVDSPGIGSTRWLPTGYKPVDCLISSGEEYIDTKYIPTKNTGYRFKAQSYSSEEGYFLGSNQTENWSENTRIYFHSGNPHRIGWGSWKNIYNDSSELYQELEVELNFLNSNYCYVNVGGTKTLSQKLSNGLGINWTPTISVYLFALNFTGKEAQYHLKGKIKEFFISENDKIVRHYIPCLDSSGVPCMYEIYTGETHYNEGNGTFSYPRPYVHQHYNLPAGYTKCTYLQSTGEQWINTGISANINTGIYAEIQNNIYSNTIPFGARNSQGYYYEIPRYNVQTKFLRWAFGSAENDGFASDKMGDYSYKASMNLYNDRQVSVDSEDTKWRAVIVSPAEFKETYPLWLFSFNYYNNETIVSYGKFVGRIYRAKITQGRELVRDLVPCLDTNKKPCMYDIVTGASYYNSGTGADFEYCIEHQLPQNFRRIKWLESTGTQYIDTKIIPTNTTGIYIDAHHSKEWNMSTDILYSYPMGCKSTTAASTHFLAARVPLNPSASLSFGWGDLVYPGGGGDVRYEHLLNWLNNRTSRVSAQLNNQRVTALGTLPFTPTVAMTIFGVRSNDLKVYPSCYRIYQLRISEGTSVIRDFIPAYDVTKQRPCLYDLIEGKAYYNDGEGEFDYDKEFEGLYKGSGILGGIGNRLGYMA